jgi:hypothetical protein
MAPCPSGALLVIIGALVCGPAFACMRIKAICIFLRHPYGFKKIC